MLYVLSNSSNPFYNLATEEYLLKHKAEEYFMLWRSESAVIVGKHQNLPAEINYQFIRENNIKVARRLTGGGTVVHDMQNLNFTFIVNGVPGKLIDFKKHLLPIVEFLNTLGITATIGVKNDIRIGELKISGNAEHVYKNRVLHHGTLLFNSDLERLQKAIRVVPGKYIDKAVQSNRSGVTNIVGFLKNPMRIEAFTMKLMDFIAGNNSFESKADLSIAEIESINKLVQDKYATNEWIWEYSPRYTFRNSFENEGQVWKVMLEVEKGCISNAEISINGVPNNILSERLKSLPHRFEDLNKWIRKNNIDISISNSDKLTYCFF